MVNELQCANDRVPMVVTLLGIVIDVRPLPLNTSCAIIVKFALVGNETVDKLVQLLNALLPIAVTEFGIVIDVKLAQS